MTVLEIISAILLILACVFIILVVLMQDSKQGMSQAISGSTGDNYYQKNSGRSKEARLSKMTRTAAIVLFVVALLVNVVSIYGWGESSGDDSSTTTTAATTTAEETSAESSESASEETAE